MAGGVVTNGVQDISSWRRVLLRLKTVTEETLREGTAKANVLI